MGKVFTITHPAITLAIKSATVAQAQSEDNSFPFQQPTWNRSDCSKYILLQICYLRTLADKKQRTKAVTGWLRLTVLTIEMGGGGRGNCCYLLLDEPLGACDVITQHH